MIDLIILLKHTIRIAPFIMHAQAATAQNARLSLAPSHWLVDRIHHPPDGWHQGDYPYLLLASIARCDNLCDLGNGLDVDDNECHSSGLGVL